MNSNEKYKLITRDLEEIINDKQLKEILEKRDLNVYWGTAPTGKIHIGYLIPLTKISDLLEAGSNVKILIADLHAFLDSQKTPEALLEARSKYYEITIKETLKALKVPINKLTFVRGRSFQLKEDYTLDFYRLSNITTVSEAKKSGAEVVKQSENPKLAPLLYPLLQAIDEEYLKVDAQFGGLDQRKIFVLAHEFLPKIGYKQRIHLMNPLLPGLTGGKMSASNENSKIDLLDDAKTISKKLSKAYCPAGEKENNGILLFTELVIFKYLNRINKPYLIERPEKYGGNLIFKTYEELENVFLENKLHPMDLKNSLAKYLIEILKPLRDLFEKEENKKILEKAYN